MPNFNYKAYDRKGRATSGQMQAENAAGVSNSLSKQGYIPVSVTAVSSGFSLGPLFGKVNLTDVMVFTRQLWTLQKAGIPLQASLVSLRDQVTDPRFKKIIIEVIRSIEGGSSLSSAMASHPEAFDLLYVNMVKAGEASGKLDEVLFYLAEMCEFEAETREKIKSATRYPILALITLVFAFLMIVSFVIPKFSILFHQFKKELPMPTRILLGINHLIQHEWFLMLFVLVAFVFLFRFYTNTKQGRYQWDYFKIKMPVTGPLLFNLVMARFAKILSQLLSSGIPILQALQLVSDTVGNTVVQKAVIDIQRSVNEGKGMSEPMKRSGFFSPMVVQMVAVGEQSGQTEELLEHVSSYYELQANTMIKNLTTLIEPVLIAFLGLIVLFLALGIFLPMWDLTYIVR